MRFFIMLVSLLLTVVCGLGGQLLVLHDKLSGLKLMVANTFWLIPLITAYSCFQNFGKRTKRRHESTFSADSSDSDKKSA